MTTRSSLSRSRRLSRSVLADGVSDENSFITTPKDAITILEKNGFQIDFEIVRDDVGKITYNGERVGTLYEDEIYIASEFPHLRNKSYEDTEKQGSVRFASRTARSDLDDCIQVLFKSPAALEEEMRAKHVYNIQQYFKKKKVQLMKTMVERLSDALNEVRTASTELNDEQ